LNPLPKIAWNPGKAASSPLSLKWKRWALQNRASLFSKKTTLLPISDSSLDLNFDIKMKNGILTVLGVLQFTFNVALLSIFGKEEILYRDALKRCYYTLEQGYNSMPINVPGTLFHKAMKARKELAQILAQIISSRRQRKQDYKDLLGSFMGEKAGLTDEQIADNVIGVIFAARDTTASVLTWIVKYLGENPSVLEAVTVSVWVLPPFIFVDFEGIKIVKLLKNDSHQNLICN